MSDVQTVLANFDEREDFRDVLIEVQKSLRSERKFVKSLQVGKVLRRRGLFEQVYQESTKAAAADYISANASGDFGKYFLDWLNDGGLETIIALIETLIKLFG